MANTTKVLFMVSAAVLFSIILLGFFYLSTVSIAEQTVGTFSYATWLLIAYAAGLSMIVLPCTLPLVFIIVPLCMGKGYKKGLFMALLFGLGLTITITVYGLVIALLGQYAGIGRATQIMWFFAGIVAYTFGLSELKLLTLKMPAYMKTPAFIEKRGDYLKSLFMGLLLGNAGVGCPNPFFYFMLIYIMGTGSVAVGGSLGLIHGIGRAVPLLFVAILAILGISATNALVKHRVGVEKATGWGLIGIGAFILLQGIFGHGFWERSPVHFAWNRLIQSIGLSAEMTMGAYQIMPIPWTLLGLLILIPIIWYQVRKHVLVKKIVDVCAIVLIIGFIIGGYMLSTSLPMEMSSGEVKEFNMTAFQFGFDPGTIEVNQGDHVIIHAMSIDVAHGIAIAEYGINEVLLPNKPVTIEFTADKVGTFTFYCSVACGAGHHDQKGMLIVKDSHVPEK